MFFFLKGMSLYSNQFYDRIMECSKKIKNNGWTHSRQEQSSIPWRYKSSNILLIIGSFAMWGGVFSSMDCLLIYYRQKDDPWNAIAAGCITGGVLAIRGQIDSKIMIMGLIGGASVAFKNAMMGGVILALIEGVSTVVTSISMRNQYKMMEEMQK